MAKDAELQQQIVEIQQNMIQMQQQTLDRLALIQNRVQAILVQNYELHEYPIPRLFIVLPKTLPSGIRVASCRASSGCTLCVSVATILGRVRTTATVASTSATMRHIIYLSKHEG